MVLSFGICHLQLEQGLLADFIVKKAFSPNVNQPFLDTTTIY